VLALAAFSLWPNTKTVHTGPTANLPDAQRVPRRRRAHPKGRTSRASPGDLLGTQPS
jgi:hypothetical protein